MSAACTIEATLFVHNPTATLVEERFAVPATPLVTAFVGEHVVRVEAGSNAELALESSVTVFARDGLASLVFPAVRGRHVLFGEYPVLGDRFAPLIYEPARWTRSQTAAPPAGKLAVTLEGDYYLEDERNRETHSRERHEIRIRQPADLWSFGGPLLGIGGTFGEGLRMCAGVEYGFLTRYLARLSLESDLSGEWAMAATASIATPILWIVPSVGVGAGGVVVATPEERGGVRLIADLVAFAAGMVWTFDYFPAQDDWRISLLGQLSL